jgi:hypothetical protein
MSGVRIADMTADNVAEDLAGMLDGRERDGVRYDANAGGAELRITAKVGNAVRVFRLEVEEVERP